MKLQSIACVGLVSEAQDDEWCTATQSVWVKHDGNKEVKVPRHLQSLIKISGIVNRVGL